jgi:hypothetical protein
MTPEEKVRVNAAIDEMKRRKVEGRAFAAAYYDPICVDPASKLNLEMQQPPREIDDWALGYKRYEDGARTLLVIEGDTKLVRRIADAAYPTIQTIQRELENEES